VQQPVLTNELESRDVHPQDRDLPHVPVGEATEVALVDPNANEHLPAAPGAVGQVGLEAADGCRRFQAERLGDRVLRTRIAIVGVRIDTFRAQRIEQTWPSDGTSVSDLRCAAHLDSRNGAVERVIFDRSSLKAEDQHDDHENDNRKSDDLDDQHVLSGLTGQAWRSRCRNRGGGGGAAGVPSVSATRILLGLSGSTSTGIPLPLMIIGR
jgi:hypothetical protein